MQMWSEAHARLDGGMYLFVVEESSQVLAARGLRALAAVTIVQPAVRWSELCITVWLELCIVYALIKPQFCAANNVYNTHVVYYLANCP